jgi:predicted chitinase
VSSPSSAPASSGAPKAVGKPVGKAAGNKAALEAQMAKAGMTDPKERAAFMAQMDHESGGFKYMNELASGKAYEGRKDLGNTAEGDGVKYKGRGFIQLTGKANYKKYGDMLGIDLVSNPDMAADPAIASQIATAYWNDRKIGGKTLSEQAKAGNFDMVTKGINGGTNGKADRDQKYAAYLAEANGGAPVPAPTGNTVMPSSPKAATTAMGVTPATATALSPTNPSGYTYSAKTSTTGPSSSTSSAGTDSKRVVDLLSQIADNTAPIKDAFGSLKSDGGAPGSAGKLPTKRAAGIKNDLKSQETIKTGNLSSNSNSDW